LSHQAKPLLILDLDETLVHTVEVDKPQPPGLTPDYVVGSCRHQVYRRPFLDEFLTIVGQYYDLAVWSSAGSLYVEPTVELIFADFSAPLFVWSSNRCTRRFDHESHQEYFIKDLKKVRKKGFDPERMLIVDDTPQKSERNFGSVVYIAEFNGEVDDCELLYLAQYLVSIANHANFRNLEKRGWRQKP
jgi:RNA polymerase II subunit A small phosphatase-like protein